MIFGKRFLKNFAIGLINLVIFAALVHWLVDNIRYAELIRHLQALPLASIIVGSACNVAAVIFSGFRLAVLMQRPRSVSLQIANLGFGFNAVLPLRMGELARLHYAKGLFGVPVGKLFTAGLIEKYFDLLAIGGLLLWLLVYGNAGYFGRSLMLSLFGGILLVGGGALLARRLSWLVERVAARSRLATALVEGLREHAKVHDLPRVFLYTAAIWAANVEVAYTVFPGFLPSAPFGQMDAVILILITALAVAIPSAPSGLGVMEAGVVAYLTQSFHVENELALAAAIVFHAVVTVPQIVAMLAVLALQRRAARPPRRMGGETAD